MKDKIKKEAFFYYLYTLLGSKSDYPIDIIEKLDYIKEKTLIDCFRNNKTKVKVVMSKRDELVINFNFLDKELDTFLNILYNNYNKTYKPLLPSINTEIDNVLFRKCYEDTVKNSNLPIAKLIKTSKLTSALSQTNIIFGKDNSVKDRIYINNSIIIAYNSIKKLIEQIVSKYVKDNEIKRIIFTGFGLGGSIAQIAFITNALKQYDTRYKFIFYGYGIPYIGNKYFNDFYRYIVSDTNNKSLIINYDKDIVNCIFSVNNGYSKLKSNIELSMNNTLDSHNHNDLTYIAAFKDTIGEITNL
jgi:hypothetical protein